MGFEVVLPVAAVAEVVGLGPKVAQAVVAAEFQADEVVDLVLAGDVVGDPVFGVGLVLRRLADIADAAGVPAAADRRRGDAEGLTGG